jgi:ABC-type polysaccharide/polyol phosphate export permease
MSSKTVTVSGGVGFFGLLTIVLIVLKLIGLVPLSWWWIVFLPILGPCVTLFVFGSLFVIGFFLVFAVKEFLEYLSRRSYKKAEKRRASTY